MNSIMLWLRSFDNFDILGSFDPNSGRLATYDHKRLGEDAPKQIAGLFAVLADKLAILYKSQGALIFRLGRFETYLDAELKIELKAAGVCRRMSIKRHDALIYELSYRLHELSDVRPDITPFAEAEDFDFGLLVAHLASDQRRREVLLQEWS